MDGAAAALVDPHHAMRQAQDRRFEREGIPMVLALFDEDSEDRRLPPTTEPAVLRSGAVYADLTGRWNAELFPQARDNDLAASIVVLQAVSHGHLLPATVELRAGTDPGSDTGSRVGVVTGDQQ